ncbi:MAG: hypothetical protein LBF49_00160 [Puniceicoccales bacterium]|jgi:hypothetical protein|nr:hypothetical protein [Puniceicoccales bacterium]
MKISLSKTFIREYLEKSEDAEFINNVHELMYDIEQHPTTGKGDPQRVADDVAPSKSDPTDNVEFDTAERAINFLIRLTDILNSDDNQDRKDNIPYIVDLFFEGLKERTRMAKLEREIDG